MQSGRPVSPSLLLFPENAPIERCTEELRRCPNCKNSLLLSCFRSVVARNGTQSLTKTCEPCLEKAKARRDSVHGKAVTAAYNASESGKATQYRKNHGTAGTARAERYTTDDRQISKRRVRWTRWSKTAGGAATIRAWLRSESGKESKRKSSRKFRNTTKFQEYMARRRLWQESPAGEAWIALRQRKWREHAKKRRDKDPTAARSKQREYRRQNNSAVNATHRAWIEANHKRHLEKRRAWLREMMKDASFRLRTAIQKRMSKTMHGHVSSTGTTFEYTQFVDSDDAIAHFEQQFKPGMRRWNYGYFWNHDHLIARVHYNWDNEDDIRRCQSKKNLVPEYVSVNSSKGTKLPPIEVLERMRDVYPKAWNGVVPSNIDFA